MHLRSSLILVLFISCMSLSSAVEDDDNRSFWYPVAYKKNCAFPFTYNNKQYTDCTTDGDNGDTPWCSMTTEYQGLINYCYDFRKTSPRLKCQDSYEVNRKTYSGCAQLSKLVPYKQCKPENSTLPFRYCTDALASKTLKPMDNRATCDPEYKKLSNFHTMCYGPNHYANVVPLTEDEKRELLNIHNDIRSEVGSRYMFKLYWDNELAKLAQAHTNLCAFEHDLAKNRLSPIFNWKNGQNIVMSTEFRSSPASLFKYMLETERKNFYYNSKCSPGSNTCLHYTQAVISNITRMGCGQTHCVYPDRLERFITCNYIQSQYSDNYLTPYVQSEQKAVDCPSNQDNGLCDCGDKICAYDQSEYLDPATCTCKSGGAGRSKRSLDIHEDEIENSQQGYVAIKTGNLPKLSKRSLKKLSLQQIE